MSRKLILCMSLFLVLGIMTLKAHECPPGSIQMVDLYQCRPVGPDYTNCNYYTHYCFECASVEGVLTIKSISWLLSANPGCMLPPYQSCINNAIDIATGNMSNPLWWQTYANQLCFNAYSGARPCTDIQPKKIIYTDFPICWEATLVSQNGGENQYSFDPCLTSKHCVIEWEVCWNPVTSVYDWTLKGKFLEGNGLMCTTPFDQTLLTSLTLGQTTINCFYFPEVECP